MALRKKLLTISAVVLAALCVYAVAMHRPEDSTLHTIMVGDTMVRVDIAATEATREEGLSGRSALSDGTGMLFEFDHPGMYGFWMKDMHFPIDIIYISADHTVISVSPSLTPESYPQIFYPVAPAQYVLEVPAGFSAAHAVVPGTKIVL